MNPPAKMLLHRHISLSLEVHECPQQLWLKAGPCMSAWAYALEVVHELRWIWPAVRLLILILSFAQPAASLAPAAGDPSLRRSWLNMRKWSLGACGNGALRVKILTNSVWSFLWLKDRLAKRGKAEAR